MTDEIYILCEYCGILTDINDNHISLCAKDSSANYNEQEGIISCYSCGMKNQQYSKSQMQKLELARCRTCVENNVTTKFMPYQDVAYNGASHLNVELYDNIANLNYQKVIELLNNGADPNYIRQEFMNINDMLRPLYNHDATEKSERDQTQPNTPIKLCVFRFSDCLLNDNDRMTLIDIANILITHGADTRSAFQYFISRYGQCLNAVDCSSGTGQCLNAVDCSSGTGQRLNAVDCSSGTGQCLNAVDCSSGTGQRLNAVDCSSGTGRKNPINKYFCVFYDLLKQT